MVARCSSIAAANSSGPPTLITEPVAAILAAIEPSAAASLKSAAIFCLERLRHGLEPDQAVQAFEDQRRIALLDGGRNTRHERRALLVVERDQLDPVGAPLRLHDRKRRHHHLDAALREVGGRHVDVTVGDLRDIQLLVMGVGPERELGQAGHQAGIELAGIGACGLGELADGVVGRASSPMRRPGWCSMSVRSD